MFERPDDGSKKSTKKPKAIVVAPRFQALPEQADVTEFIDLATAAGAEIVSVFEYNRRLPNPAYCIGKGKLEEIHDFTQAEDITLVFFNHQLTPVQERNLEKVLECRVLDRTGVILDIFSQRARSFEGKLQVELAQLRHLSTRLVRGWSHLERQKGGIGLRGPGETQLETDRRLLAVRIKQINRRLAKVSKQRDQGRRSRRRAELPSIALVGYTNAGKSTLFNHLTKAEVFAADQLFATLDPTLRRVTLPNKIPFILADTVGFVQQLPHELIAAFRATLDETIEADVLLHVIDSSDPERLLRIEQVNEVLTDIGAHEIPQILVYNKIDCQDVLKAGLEYNEEGKIKRVHLSAMTGEGMEGLWEALTEVLSATLERHQIRIPVSSAHIRAKIYELGHVLQEDFAENGDYLLDVEIEQRHIEKMRSEYAADDLQLL